MLAVNQYIRTVTWSRNNQTMRSTLIVSLTCVLLWANSGLYQHLPTVEGFVEPCEIAFSLGISRIYIIDVETTDRRLLIDAPGGDPVWSPDGQRIAYISNRRTYELHVVDSDGTNHRSLAQNLFLFDEPVWSPDGVQIAFIQDYTSRFGEENKLYVVDLETGKSRLLSDRPGYHGFPAWSPDGTKIAFTIERGRQSGIYLINPDGSDLQRLTQDGIAPQWSPDGTQIAFVSRRDGDADIYLIGTGGESERNLTESDGDDYNPTWSPDGTRLAFVSDRDGNKEIYVIDVEGNDLERLTERDAEDYRPTWSPDGSRIAFLSNAITPFWEDIWVIDTDGENMRNLTDGGSNARPVWSPLCSSE